MWIPSKSGGKTITTHGKTYEEAKEKMDKLLGITPPKIPLPKITPGSLLGIPHIAPPPKSIIKKLQSGRKLRPP